MPATPAVGERSPWKDRIWFGWDVYDDGGGPALAAYQFANCG